jgi:uncharacterized SAM-binding protein YcdF (DUF218 family)
MFFLFSKLLAFIISPIVWVFALLIHSFFTKIETRAKKLRIIAVVFLYIFSNSFIIDELYRAYETVTPDHDLSAAHFNGAIVLGGIATVDQRLNKVAFNYSGDRLFQTLRLLKQNRIDKLIFTGGSGSIEFPELKEGIYIHRYLNEIGINDSLLLIEKESKNTYENAVFTKKILDSLTLHSNLLLVTSAYHMPRALAVFKKAGYPNITPYVTNKLSGQRRYTFDHLFIPNPDALFNFQFLMHEWVGFIMYKIKGYA